MYKFSAILKDLQLNIAAKAPSMLLSTASGAAGGWEGNWWGGNLKGLTLAAAKWYPDLIAFVASTGGVNVMTYDLSDDGAVWGCALPAAHASALSLSHPLSPSPNLPPCCLLLLLGIMGLQFANPHDTPHRACALLQRPLPPCRCRKPLRVPHAGHLHAARSGSVLHGHLLPGWN